MAGAGPPPATSEISAAQRLELQTKVREDFSITEKAPTAYWGLFLVESAYKCSDI